MPRRIAALLVVTACGSSPTPAISPATGATTSAVGPASSPTPPQIACGGFHTCQLVGDGTVTCWGRNAEGELGDGTTQNRTTPTRVAGITNATALALGHHSSCALL